MIVSYVEKDLANFIPYDGCDCVNFYKLYITYARFEVSILKGSIYDMVMDIQNASSLTTVGYLRPEIDYKVHFNQIDTRDTSFSHSYYCPNDTTHLEVIQAQAQKRFSEHLSDSINLPPQDNFICYRHNYASIIGEGYDGNYSPYYDYENVLVLLLTSEQLKKFNRQFVTHSYSLDFDYGDIQECEETGTTDPRPYYVQNLRTYSMNIINFNSCDLI